MLNYGILTELMEMLKIMRHKMQEMDNQLKIQLQLKDEYIDAKLKRRDHILDEALRLRNEEWKSIWETRERELNEELKAREDAFLYFFFFCSFYDFCIVGAHWPLFLKVSHHYRNSITSQSKNHSM